VEGNNQAYFKELPLNFPRTKKNH